MSRLLRAIFVVAAMLALQPYVSLASHLTEQQAIQAFQALQARVDALELGAGQIGGVVACDDGGATQVLVHIPGRSTVARTDSTGDFVLSNVPVGTHDVVFELAGEVIHTEAGVSVLDQLGTDLGFLDICPDVDADGFDVTLDCDDTDFDINPDATEVCDEVDNDCDGAIDEDDVCVGCINLDGDGFCGTDDDCDELDATVYPGAHELCDGLDNDFDGTIDEELATQTFFQDNDGDLFGDFTVTVEACAAPFGFVLDNTDCNDAVAAINPGASEICNGVDDDCDAQVDEGGVCG